MNTGYFITFIILISLLMLIVQRTETAKRRLVLIIMILPAILLRNFALYREVETEALTAFWVALFLNFLFWLFIGRNNPVRSSEEIKVLGMDD
jgi:hypothetical protein